MAIFDVQKISTTNKTIVTSTYGNYNSVVFTNTHATADVTIDLYVASQVGTDITNTTVIAAEVEGVSTASTILTVKTVNATDDALLNERVYKSTGVLFGVCTAVTDTTHIVFGGGLSNATAVDDALFTGTRYHILNNVKIPNGASLKLMSDEIKFNSDTHTLYINSDNAAGAIDIITRY